MSGISNYKEAQVHPSIKIIKKNDINRMLKQDSFFVPKKKLRTKESYVKKLLTSIEYKEFKNRILSDFLSHED
jgi:hypothetical protein